MNITRLLNIELLKFRKNAVIRMLFFLFVIFLPIAIFMGKELNNLPDFIISKDVFFVFPTIWEYMGYIGNWMVFFFLGVIAVYIFSIEVSNKTLRQSIINGLTRKEFFVSKFITILLISVFASIYYGVCTMIIGYFHTETFSLTEALNNDWAVTRFFLMSLGYLSLALFLAILIRKPGLSVFSYLIYVIVIEPVIRASAAYMKVPMEYLRFFPANVMEDLHPLPFYKIPAANFGPSTAAQYLLSYNLAIVFTILFIVLFLTGSYVLLRKKDL